MSENAIIDLPTGVVTFYMDVNEPRTFNSSKYSSLHTNSLARSPGQVKLDSDKWKLWKNLFE
jgi:hypothetical protein